MAQLQTFEDKCSIESYLQGDSSLLIYLPEIEKKEKIRKLLLLKGNLKNNLETLELEWQSIKNSLDSAQEKKSIQTSNELKYSELLNSIKLSEKNCEKFEAEIAELNYINRTRKNKNSDKIASKSQKDPNLIHQNNKIGFENLRNRYTKTIQKNTRNLELIKAKQLNLDQLETQYNELKLQMQMIREDNQRIEKQLELKKEMPKIWEIEKKESYFLKEKAVNLKRRCEEKGLIPKKNENQEEFVNFENEKTDKFSQNYRLENERLTNFEIQEQNENQESDEIAIEMRSISVKPLEINYQSIEALKPLNQEKETTNITLTPLVNFN